MIVLFILIALIADAKHRGWLDRWLAISLMILVFTWYFNWGVKL